MIIDGVEYAPVHIGATKKQIIVAHRGFVFVGDVEDADGEVVIHNAKNIRRWGTSYGLGQLAMEGVQPDSMLDDALTVRLHPLSIVCRYDCNGEVWK